MMDIKSKRITLVEKEHYRVDLEFNEDFAILHLPSVSKFTKEVYLDGRRCFKDFEEFLSTCGYSHIWVAVPPEDSILNKFVLRFNFSYVTNTHGYNVYNKGIK